MPSHVYLAYVRHHLQHGFDVENLHFEEKEILEVAPEDAWGVSGTAKQPPPQRAACPDPSCPHSPAS